MINNKFGFTVNWQKHNIKQGNIVCIKSDKSSDDYLIGHETTEDGKDRYLASNIKTGEVIEDADNIELLGIRLRGYYIATKKVRIVYVYANSYEYGCDF